MAFDPYLGQDYIQAIRQIEAREAYTNAVLANAAIKFGIKNGKLDQQELAKQADKIVTYVEGELLKQRRDLPNPFEFNPDKVNAMNAYHRYIFFSEEMQFDPKSFTDVLYKHGLSPTAISNHVIPQLYGTKRAMHERAALADFDPRDLTPVVNYLEGRHGITMGGKLKSDPGRLRELLFNDRTNRLDKPTLEQMADVEFSRITAPIT